MNNVVRNAEMIVELVDSVLRTNTVQRFDRSPIQTFMNISTVYYGETIKQLAKVYPHIVVCGRVVFLCAKKIDFLTEYLGLRHNGYISLMVPLSFIMQQFRAFMHAPQSVRFMNMSEFPVHSHLHGDNDTYWDRQVRVDFEENFAVNTRLDVWYGRHMCTLLKLFDAIDYPFDRSPHEVSSIANIGVMQECYVTITKPEILLHLLHLKATSLEVRFTQHFLSLSVYPIRCAMNQSIQQRDRWWEVVVDSRLPTVNALTGTIADYIFDTSDVSSLTTDSSQSGGGHGDSDGSGGGGGDCGGDSSSSSSSQHGLPSTSSHHSPFPLLAPSSCQKNHNLVELTLNFKNWLTANPQTFVKHLQLLFTAIGTELFTFTPNLKTLRIRVHVPGASANSLRLIFSHIYTLSTYTMPRIVFGMNDFHWYPNAAGGVGSAAVPGSLPSPLTRRPIVHLEYHLYHVDEKFMLQLTKKDHFLTNLGASVARQPFRRVTYNEALAATPGSEHVWKNIWKNHNTGLWFRLTEPPIATTCENPSILALGYMDLYCHEESFTDYNRRNQNNIPAMVPLMRAS